MLDGWLFGRLQYMVFWQSVTAQEPMLVPWLVCM